MLMTLALARYAHIVAIFITIFTTGCAVSNSFYDPTKHHHAPEGFRNNYVLSLGKSIGDLLRWQWEALRAGVPKPPQQPTPVVAPDLALIHGYRRSCVTLINAGSPPALTWIGHATMLVQAGGLNVLTDPVFSESASPVQFFGPRRVQPPGVALDDLPPIDVVIISHNHYDHLDTASVVALDYRAKSAGGRTLFLVPLGIKSWLEKLGVTHVVELDWWQQYTVLGVEFYLTPVQHWSARSLSDHSETLWGGWAVLGPDFHWYFSGDTGYSKDFSDTREYFASRHTPTRGGGFDAALIPVGGYEPRWFMAGQHVNPAEAVQVHLDIGAKRSVGVHWGTFNLTDEPLDQPPKDLAAAKAARGIKDEDFFLLKIGETRLLPARTTVNPQTASLPPTCDATCGGR